MMQFLWKPQPSRAKDDQKKIEDLTRELELVKADYAQLQKQMKTNQVSCSGYMLKFRSAYALLTSEWDLRYFTLNGTSLKYYKTERDTTFNPREEYDITGCIVQWEGLVQGRHWALSVMDPSGHTVIRLASISQSTAEKWITVLAAAGCARINRNYEAMARLASSRSLRIMPREDQGLASINRSATYGGLDEAAVRLRGGRQNRWDADSDTHSEMTDAGSKTLEVNDAGGGSATSRGANNAHASANDAGAESAHAGGESGGNRGPMVGSTPVHTATRFSYLSSERHWQEKHTGMYNLGIVILFAANFRLALENALKYGWRLNFVSLARSAFDGNINWSLLVGYPALLAFTLCALAVETLAVRLLRSEEAERRALAKKEALETKEGQRRMSKLVASHEWLMFMVNLLNTSAALLLPCVLIAASDVGPVAAGILCTCSIVLWMKLVSYNHCCWDLRNARRRGEVRSGERGSPDTPADWGVHRYPENLTAANLAYFMAAPTLCYQVNYPRSPKIRYDWLLRRVIEMLVFLAVLSIIVTQYIQPAVENSLVPLQQSDWGRVCERILKLSIPSLYAWLCIFYCLFHLWLNVLAELLRFGDREFYKDWWNAATLGEYWRQWNMPVHKWLLRHCYFPAIRHGMPKLWAIWLTFFVSAVAHELVLGVPLRMVRLWAFGGILGQVPLIMLTEAIRKRLRRDEWGNYVFWLSFCIVGQPLITLLYYHDWVVQGRV